MIDLAALKSLEVVLRVVSGAFKWGSRKFLEYFEKPGERADLISRLFLGEGKFLFNPSDDWRPAAGQKEPPATGGGYPHDVRALRGFVPFLSEAPTFEKSLIFRAQLSPSDRLVCAGSPKANRMVRAYLPSFRLDGKGASQQYPTLLAAEKLRYFFGEDLTVPKVSVVSMMEKGEKREKTRKVLWKWTRDDLEPWRPKGYLKGEELRRDFLLVSRLLRTEIGGDLLIFAGAHGAGTEAARLLLESLHIRHLRRLNDAIGGHRYFQFVVEVTDVSHGKSGTLPKEITISEDLPPVQLDLAAKDLNARPTRPRRVWG